MKKTLGILAMALMAGGTMFAQPRVSIGIGVGGYGPAYPPPAYAQYMPPCPGPDYSWVAGLWGPRNVWVNGYWRGPVGGGYRVAPRYFAPRHDDRDYRGRDRDRDRDRGYERGFRR
jgi:hypothetical protein